MLVGGLLIKENGICIQIILYPHNALKRLAGGRRVETVYLEFDHRRANHIYVWRTACIVLFICQIQTFRCRFLSFYLFACETQCMIQSAMFCYLYIITEYSTSTPCVYIYIYMHADIQRPKVPSVLSKF